MVSVSINPVRDGERCVIENLLQLYTHDFSELWAGGARGELGKDGRFPDYPLDPYFSAGADAEAFLIWVGGHIAGFALLNAHSHSGRPVARAVAEFFVVRKHRRFGVGRIAARLLFETRRGVWEAAVVRRNAAALAFWRNVVEGWESARNVEVLDVRTAAWDGPIVRFERA